MPEQEETIITDSSQSNQVGNTAEQAANEQVDTPASTDSPAATEDKAVEAEIAKEEGSTTPESTAKVSDAEPDLYDVFQKVRDGVSSADALATKAPVKPDPAPKKEDDKNPEGTPTTVATKPDLTKVGDDLPESRREIMDGHNKYGKVRDGKVVKDLSGFTTEEAKLLSKMTYDTWNYVRPRLLDNIKLKEDKAKLTAELNELKTGKYKLPDNYYEHEQAFVLDPSFNREAETMQTAYNIQQHWQQQAAKIRKGEKWQDLDMQNGKLVLGAPQEATADSEAQAFANLQMATGQLLQQQQKVSSIKNSFASRREQAINVLKEAEAKHFSGYDAKDHPARKVTDAIYESIPPEFRSHPLAKLMAYSSASAILLAQALNAEKAKNASGTSKQVTIQQQARKAGPTAADTGSSISGNGTKKVDGDNYEDFLNVIRDARGGN